MTLSFASFLEASGGRVAGGSGTLPAMFRPSTDSRTLERGDSFVCLRGPNFDGHNFIAEALARGACAVIADQDRAALREASVPVVRVANAKAAYLLGAAFARKQFAGQVIAITGSNGKTTTKEFTAQLVSARRRVLVTPQNENNELGVAKLCYRLDDDVDVAVIEFGARHPGEIAELVLLAAPGIGVLTGVGEAHLEFFRDHAELARTKFALFSGGARPVCSAADTWSRTLAAESHLDRSTLWVRLVGDPIMPGIMLEAGEPRDGSVAVTFGASHAFAAWRLPGAYNLRNALLATGAAILAGLTFEQCLERFDQLRLPPGRFESHRLQGGATVIYDAYNASPTSMVEALRAFASLPAQRRIAVLGSMAELGAQAAILHRSVGAAAARLGLDRLYCGGAYSSELAAGASDAGLATAFTFANNDEIIQVLRAEIRAGDCLLLKGSRVEKMEQILDGLCSGRVGRMNSTATTASST